MSRSTVSTLETIKMKHYKIKLTRRQGWAGPACYVYVLRKKIFVLPLYFKVTKKQVWCNTDALCVMDFERKRKETVRLNFCADKTIKHRKKNRGY